MADERELEMASLLPDRCYIILRKIDDDNFSVAAYDTVATTEDDEYIDAVEVAVSGIMEILENDFERVVSAGMARIAFHETAETMLQEVDDGGPTITSLPDSNIVKVDFGTEQ
jgi:hypothetical protein